MTETAGEQRRTYGHYEVESVLGRGAMGMVYLARDRRIGRRVALKTVHVDEKFEDESEAGEFFKRLQREAELGGALQHPNIVTLYEPGYENNVIAWLATEYVEGESLRDRLRKRKPLPLSEALRIAEDMLRGLAFAHAKGIVHRDIKPANILIASSGEAKIADFGIARPPESNLTAVGEMLGTPSYMSPEQVKCTPVTARSDLFSTGAVIYEMVSGAKAFTGADVTTILRNVVEAPLKPVHEVNPDIPPAVSQFVSRLMAKAPEQRFESASAALEELRKIRLDIDDTEPEPEQVGPSEGVSTLAAHATHPSATTDVDIDDQTPALSTPAPFPLRRRVTPAVFFGTISILLAAFATAALAILARTDATPTVTYSLAQLKEFSDKEQTLNAAQVVYKAGDYERAIAMYDAYLKRYPNSIRASAERAEAVEALNASKASKVTVSAKRPKKTPTKTEEKPPEPKKSFWRRIFRP